jgi:hypothetical protein
MIMRAFEEKSIILAECITELKVVIIAYVFLQFLVKVSIRASNRKDREAIFFAAAFPEKEIPYDTLRYFFVDSR